jgi:multiple sugar transport system substrate-binding protein
MTSTKKSVVVAGLAIAGLALGACGGGTGAGTTAGASGGSGQEVKTIKIVAAEYSKDHTKAFWDAFAKTYHDKTGYTLEVQVVSWDNIDQQSSTMIQNNQAPDILNLNAYASYAKDGLLYDSDAVLPAAAKSDILLPFVPFCPS